MGYLEGGSGTEGTAGWGLSEDSRKAVGLFGWITGEMWRCWGGLLAVADWGSASDAASCEALLAAAAAAASWRRRK